MPWRHKMEKNHKSLFSSFIQVIILDAHKRFLTDILNDALFTHPLCNWNIIFSTSVNPRKEYDPMKARAKVIIFFCNSNIFIKNMHCFIHTYYFYLIHCLYIKLQSIFFFSLKRQERVNPEGAGTFSTRDRPGLFWFKASFPSTSSQCTLGRKFILSDN